MDPHRIPGTSFAATRDARLRAARQRKARLDRIAAMPADYSQARVTICPPGTAAGAYDAGRNLQAAARVKAMARSK